MAKKRNNKGQFVKGRPYTPIAPEVKAEAIRKMLETRKKNGSYISGAKKMAETRKREGSYRWSLESRKKASIAHAGTKKPWARKNILHLMETLRIKKANTKGESIMKAVLSRVGIEFIHQKKIDKYLVDFYIPSRHAVIEVDGEYWHDYPKGSKSDKAKNIRLKKLGYSLKRFWDKNEVQSRNLDEDIVRFLQPLVRFENCPLLIFTSDEVSVDDSSITKTS